MNSLVFSTLVIQFRSRALFHISLSDVIVGAANGACDGA